MKGKKVSERKTVTIRYRKLDRSPEFAKSTLEQVVGTAINNKINGQYIKDRYRLRVQKSGTDNYFINHLYAGDDCLFGDVIHFTDGHLQALFDSGTGQEETAPVEQMQAPERKEYIHSIMYWMIKNDHVFVIQSMSLRAEHFESYLAWLLDTKTQTLDLKTPLVLAGKFDAAAVGGDLGDIEQIIIGGLASPPIKKENIAAQQSPARADKEESEVEQSTTLGHSAVAYWHQAKEILSTLLGGKVNVDTMMSTIPSDAELSVEVHIGYKTRKRKVSREGLKNLETGLRNLPDSQLQVKSKGGTRSVDGSVRLHHNASIKFRKIEINGEQKPGSLLCPDDTFRAMKEAYEIFKANGKIEE